jgi:WhiB family redox-sensing transcriptional regulator
VWNIFDKTSSANQDDVRGDLAEPEAFENTESDDSKVDSNVIDIAELLGNMFGVDADRNLAWQMDALCAETDPEVFFPDKGGSTRDAKKICGVCSVQAECLAYAIEYDERFGVWGGTSERERRYLKSKRRGSADEDFDEEAEVYVMRKGSA